MHRFAHYVFRRDAIGIPLATAQGRLGGVVSGPIRAISNPTRWRVPLLIGELRTEIRICPEEKREPLN